MYESRIVHSLALVTLAVVGCCCGGRAMAQMPASNVEQIERGILEKINQNRQIFGLPPLQPDPTLSQVAREHSADMMRLGTATHESAIPGRRTPEDRYQQAFGAAPGKLSENVAVAPKDFAIPDLLYVALTAQPGTLQNVIDKEVTTVGVGVAVGSDGRVWATAMLAAPAGRPAPARIPQPPPETPAPRPAPQPAPPPRQPAASGGTGVYWGDLAPEFFAFIDAAGGYSEMFRLGENLPSGEAAAQELLAFVKAAFGAEPGRPGIRQRPFRFGALGTRLKEFQFFGPSELHPPRPSVTADRRNPTDVPRQVPAAPLIVDLARKVGGWGFNPNQALAFEATLPGRLPGLVELITHFDLSCSDGALGPDGRIGGTCRVRFYGSFDLDIEYANPDYPGKFWSTPEETTPMTWYAVPTDSTASAYRLYLDKAPGTHFVSDRLTADGLRHLPALVAVLGREGPPRVTEAPPPAPPPSVAALPRSPAPPPPSGVSAQVDEDRAADVRWLHSIEQALQSAERKKTQAALKLEALTLIVDAVQDQIDKLRKAPLEAPSENWKAAAAQVIVDGWDELWGPRPPNPRDALAVAITRLQQKIEDTRREQDELVQGALQSYQSIVDELQERGPQSGWDRVRTGAQQAVRDVSQVVLRAKAQLYMAADRKDEFLAAAQACIADGRYAADARYMEGLYYQGHGQYGPAREAFRLAEKLTASPQDAPLTQTAAQGLAAHGASVHDRSRAMGWMLDDAYLSAIAGKASAEALQARADTEERLRKGGEDGWFGFMMAGLKLGATSRIGALTGREDALQNLAGAYQDNVAAQEYGLSLMRSLHERGVALDSMDGMTNEEFLYLIHYQYKEAGQKVTPEDAVRMRAAIKAAMGNPDVSRLVAGSKQMLRVDTGADYFGHDAFTDVKWFEMAGDLISPATAAMFLMPTSVFGVAAKAAGSAEVAGAAAEAAGAVEAAGGARAAEAVVESAEGGLAAEGGVSNLALMLQQTRAGQWMLRDFARFFAGYPRVGKLGLDLTMNLIASKAGEGLGGTIGVLRGTDGKAEAEAGELFASLFAGMFSGDVALMRETMAAHGITAEQVGAVRGALTREAEQPAELVAAAEQRQEGLRRVLPSAPGEALTAEARVLAGRTKDRIIEDLREAVHDLTAAAKLNPRPDLAARFLRVQELKAELETLRAVENGDPAQAIAWSEVARDCQLNAGTNTAAAAKAAANLSGGGGGTIIPPAGAGPTAAGPTRNLIELASYRGNPLTADLDRLRYEDRFSEALAGYEDRQAFLKEFKAETMVNDGQLPLKIAATKRTLALDDMLSRWPQNGVAANYKEIVTAEEMTRLGREASRVANPTVKLEPVSAGGYANPYEEETALQVGAAPAAGRVGVTANKPYWVMEQRGGRWEIIGVFKKADPRLNGRDLQAEAIAAGLGPLVGVDVPACALGQMPVDGVPADGVFVRFADGVRLEVLGTAVTPLIKKRLAAGKTTAAVVGDWDRNPGNSLVVNKGKVVEIDWGQADFDGSGRVENGYAVAGEFERLGDDQLFKAAMKRRIFVRRVNGMTTYDEQITVEDMEEDIQKWEDLFGMRPGMKDPPPCPAKVREVLAKTLKGEALERAVQVLPKRVKLLREVMTECYGTLKDLKSLPTANLNAVPFPLRRPGVAAPKVAESLALAA